MSSRIQIEMVNDLVIDQNMSNLTSTSNEISASSGTWNDNASHSYPQHSSASTIQEPQPKKKTSLPGHPDPEAEVIALSPMTLLATNRFICDVCNKGFQRDQNLQLHRRGHNLPWKLKKSNSSKEITRKKVYVCPEPTCVHHDPSRALGDLTGIKKHFCRKHGEKKWKCEKCSKRYAVQSDWKAHSKICGTRQYKCDCGTIFSRRDSFITHRAFCGALAPEGTKAITAVSPLTMSSHDIQLHSHGIHAQTEKKEKEINTRPEITSCLEKAGHGRASGFSSPPLPLSTHLDHSSVHHENPNPTTTLLPSFQSIASSSHHMSATALLQKASQIGVTMRKTSPSLIGAGFSHGFASYNENKAAGITTSDYLEEGTELAPYSLFHDMMGSTSAVHLASPFEESLRAMMNPTRDNHNFQELVSKSGESQFGKNNNANDETRDFIGLRAFYNRDWA